MQNAAVAQVFEEIADWMELAGENVFKIRAYKRAAEAVITYGAPIEDAAENGDLESIEGLGAATVAKTREFLATGRVKELERLRAEFPAGLLELLRVPGLGPKKIAQLYKERNIDSVASLNEAIAGGALKGLSGFGPKTIENIAAGLARLGENDGALSLGEALHVSHAMARSLASTRGVSEIAMGGETRRGCDQTRALKLVAKTDKPREILDAFSQLSIVLGEAKIEENRATARVHPGVAASLRAASPEDFTTQLFFATGSEKHLEEAKARASTRGLQLRADGLFRGGNRVELQDENALYHELGAQFIPAEIREGDGEWEIAERGEIPQLVEIKDIRGDLHAHSTWSDGNATIRQMAEAARARGYQYHVISDHSKALVMTNGLNAARLREQAEEIAEVQADFPDVKLLRGIECDIMRDGTMDLDDDILHELDIVIASVHSAFKLPQAEQTARMIRAISHPAIDIIAHPTGRIVGGRSGYEVDIAELIVAAREYSVVLEINASERLDLRDTHAKMARDAGVLLSIDTDAHSTRMLENIGLGILTARRAWCRAQDILNTKSATELLAWLRRPQAQRG